MFFYLGKKIKIEVSGHSHSEKIVVKASGLSGFSFDLKTLGDFLKRRSLKDASYSSSRKESDEPIFVDGVKDGKIYGDLIVEFKNDDVRKKDYDNLIGKPRPSHADLVRYLVRGETDFSGGGEFSGRMTVGYALVGGICKQILEREYGITVFAYLSSVGTAKGESYLDKNISVSDVERRGVNFPCLGAKEKMEEEIEDAKRRGDSIGGIVECVCFNLPIGIGGAGVLGMESAISAAIYAIPAVKGVEFGDGFVLASARGSDSNDPLFFNGDVVRSATNRSGGINGGVTNGEDLRLRVAFRPTPSIGIEQDTVDLISKKNTKIKIEGRHDVCVAVRAVPVVESAVAVALLDRLSEVKSK